MALLFSRSGVLGSSKGLNTDVDESELRQGHRRDSLVMYPEFRCSTRSYCQRPNFKKLNELGYFLILESINFNLSGDRYDACLCVPLRP